MPLGIVVVVIDRVVNAVIVVRGVWPYCCHRFAFSMAPICDLCEVWDHFPVSVFFVDLLSMISVGGMVSLSLLTLISDPWWRNKEFR